MVGKYRNSCKKSCSVNFWKIQWKTLFIEPWFKKNKTSSWVTWKHIWQCPIFTKIGPHHRCFSRNFPKMLRTAYLNNTSKQLPPLFKVVCDVPLYLSTLEYTGTLIHEQNKAKVSINVDSQFFLQAKLDFWR